MLFAVLSGFFLAVFAPWVYRFARQRCGWVLALYPLAVFSYLSRHLTAVSEGAVFRSDLPWVPQLGIHLSFFLDGLSLLFSLLISGIGVLVVIYAMGYFGGDRRLGRFYLFLLFFMASMLGVVLSDNLFTLFVFWELTSLSSYFLIGFNNEKKSARAAALQALLVTGIGGLLMLAGFVLLTLLTGSAELSWIRTQSELIQTSAWCVPIVVLVLLGAFTKSAQFPYHFWLPNAMEAPTPVSAYLHSSTMVKAGIYLIARFHPVLGGSEWWGIIASVIGGLTALTGAVMAFRTTHAKQLLAYSTISVLGLLTMLLGLGTSLAIQAAMVFILAHAFYKGALFLTAGALMHETGEADVEKLRGLRAFMPATALAAGVAALSMMGLPPFLGFLGKEIILDAVWHLKDGRAFFLLAALGAAVSYVVVAYLVGIRPFWGRGEVLPKKVHEAPFSMVSGIIVLAFLGLAGGIFSSGTMEGLVEASVSAVRNFPTAVHLGLWHGLSVPLLLSILILVLGGGLAARRFAFRTLLSKGDTIFQKGPGWVYGLKIDGLNKIAAGQTRWLQSGSLRTYIKMIVLTAVVLVVYSRLPGGLSLFKTDAAPPTFYETGIFLIMAVSLIITVTTQRRLFAVIALGVVGYGVALVYGLYGAPDLAMTTFMIETLTVVLIVLVFYKLPAFKKLSSPLARLQDALIAIAAGAAVTVLAFGVLGQRLDRALSDYMAQNSFSLAHGKNIVNVILVDFRGLDTMGEITVLAIAGLGVFALLAHGKSNKG